MRVRKKLPLPKTGLRTTKPLKSLKTPAILRKDREPLTAMMYPTPEGRERPQLPTVKVTCALYGRLVTILNQTILWLRIPPRIRLKLLSLVGRKRTVLVTITMRGKLVREEHL